MRKKYVVDGAILRCSLGTCTSKLTVPTHRHIKITGKRMANRADVNYAGQCIGSFGCCNRSSPPPPCTYEIRMPWVDTQETVFAAKQDAVLETSWTICAQSGRITVVFHGQGVSSTETVIENIEELEKAAAAFLGKNASTEEINELVKGIVLWGDYEQTPWKMTTNQTKMEFAQYLEKKHRDLAEYFSSKIEINDPLGEETLDISYLAGCLQADRENGDKYLYNMTDEALYNQGQMNAHIDAYLIGQEYDEKNMLFSEILKSAYGIGEAKETSSFLKNGRYATLLKPIENSLPAMREQEGEYILDTFVVEGVNRDIYEPTDILSQGLTDLEHCEVHRKRLLSLVYSVEDVESFFQSNEEIFYGVDEEHIENVERVVRENFEKEKQRRKYISMGNHTATE